MKYAPIILCIIVGVALRVIVDTLANWVMPTTDKPYQ